MNWSRSCLPTFYFNWSVRHRLLLFIFFNSDSCYRAFRNGVYGA